MVSRQSTLLSGAVAYAFRDMRYGTSQDIRLIGIGEVFCGGVEIEPPGVIILMVV